VRYLAAVLVIAMLCGILLVHVSPVSASGPTHGCAPSIPPAVAGSPAPVPATTGIIVINEVLLNPATAWNCSSTAGSDSTTDSWIELYNPQNQAFNLYTGHAMLDTGPGTNPYYFPLGTSIAAQAFLVVFPFIKLSFTSSVTSTVRLIVGGAIIDQVTIPRLGPDQSYARTPDGSSKWIVSYMPTIDASNMTGLVTPTPTPTKSSGNSNGSNGNTSSGNTSNGSTTTGSETKIVSGVQPAWSKISLPVTPTSSTVNYTAASTPTTLSSSAPVSTVSDGLDTPRRIIITLLLIALAATLFWCWRLFSSSSA
jgi:hypothetical protein